MSTALITFAARREPGGRRVLAIAFSAAVLACVLMIGSHPGSALGDPFAEQTELLGHGAGFAGGGSSGGHTAALSADGNTAIVGAQNGTSNEPSYTYLYTRTGSAWSQPVSLAPEAESGGERLPEKGFGASVAVSGNGSTALVGDTYGTAYVFEKQGATWRSTRFEPPRETACPERYGEAVALSEDGNTAIIGDPFGCPEDFDGSAWIYTRTGTTWTLQAGPLHGEQKINPLGNEDNFASTVALSGDGNTALVGADNEDANLGSALGAAWVYKRSGSTWTQDGPKLNPPGEPPGGDFGRSVALSGDGTEALVGTGAEKNEGSGAWIFSRTPSGWSAQTRLSSGENTNVAGAFGWTVALSHSGNTALIGDPETSPEQAGKAWAFGCSPQGWAREAIQPPVSTKGGSFGSAVALSGDGATALVGAHGVPGEPHPQGAVFVLSGPRDSSSACSGNATPTGAGPPSSTPTTPIVESLHQTHEVWRGGRAAATLARRRARIPVGTTFEFSLNEPSRMLFRFARLETGRITHGHCTHSRPHDRRLRRCQLAVTRGTLTLSTGAGLSRMRFDGRITRHQLLPPGFYTLTLTAEAAGARSTPRHLSFRIVA